MALQQADADALLFDFPPQHTHARSDAQRREISANAAATKDSLKALASASGAVGLSRADKVARAKLVADFQSVLKEFERASARAAAAAQSYAPREEPTRASAGAGAGEGDPLLSAAREAAEEAREREKAQQEQQLEHNTALLEEREEGIADIAAQIGEVNEIFTDLATLVNEQGAMVDDIEANMVATQVLSCRPLDDLLAICRAAHCATLRCALRHDNARHSC